MTIVKEWLEPEKLSLVQAWARDGLIDEQIARNIGISARTLYNWRDKHPEFKEALKKGKEVVDYEIENALQKRALGYQIEEVKVVTEVVDGVQRRRVEKTQKHVPGDVTAQIFWLKNRKPLQWRDRRETELSGTVKTGTQMTEAELEKEIRELEERLGIVSEDE